MRVDPNQELERYRGMLAEAQQDVVILRKLIAALESAIKDGPQPYERPSPPSPPTSRISPVTVPERKGLKRVLAELMADGQRRDVDAIFEAVVALGIYTKLPTRVTFTNRLRDLVEEGVLVRVGRGVYELASLNGDAPSLTAEGIPRPETGGKSPPAP